MILIITGIVGLSVFALFQWVQYPVLAWHLLGFISLLGGILAAHEERVNRPE